MQCVDAMLQQRLFVSYIHCDTWMVEQADCCFTITIAAPPCCSPLLLLKVVFHPRTNNPNSSAAPGKFALFVLKDNQVVNKQYSMGRIFTDQIFVKQVKRNLQGIKSLLMSPLFTKETMKNHHIRNVHDPLQLDDPADHKQVIDLLDDDTDPKPTLPAGGAGAESMGWVHAI